MPLTPDHNSLSIKPKPNIRDSYNNLLSEMKANEVEIREVISQDLMVKSASKPEMRSVYSNTFSSKMGQTNNIQIDTNHKDSLIRDSVVGNSESTSVI